TSGSHEPFTTESTNRLVRRARTDPPGGGHLDDRRKPVSRAQDTCGDQLPVVVRDLEIRSGRSRKTRDKRDTRDTGHPGSPSLSSDPVPASAGASAEAFRLGAQAIGTDRSVLR